MIDQWSGHVSRQSIHIQRKDCMDLNVKSVGDADGCPEQFMTMQQETWFPFNLNYLNNILFWILHFPYISLHLQSYYKDYKFIFLLLYFEMYWLSLGGKDT